MANLIHKQIFTVKQEGYTITASATLMNKDLLVNLTGGNVPHLGGIVSYDKKTGKVTKVHFASHDGRIHKDIMLAEQFVKRVVDQAPGNICVTAGVHVDGITAAQINASFAMVDNLAVQVITWFAGFAQEFSDPQYTTHLQNFEVGKGEVHEENNDRR
ncbi:prenylated flavin chaperone LpdD [Limosilactobacillus avium]|uniref:prenylated flavin chaperone LpdD n=1 Tax=Limosilactobacillus avium TaxID=2991831 RepID=UPI0024B93EC8|nr:hypothetical protein [Limosilactobacillus avium]